MCIKVLAMCKMALRTHMQTSLGFKSLTVVWCTCLLCSTLFSVRDKKNAFGIHHDTGGPHSVSGGNGDVKDAPKNNLCCLHPPVDNPTSYSIVPKSDA